MRDHVAVKTDVGALSESAHQPELQSARGLAALIVAIHHCSFYYNYSPYVKKISEIIFNAHAAVVFFFVLSGYVLCRSLVKHEVNVVSASKFYVRRAFRIYPALWLGLVFGFLYVLLFHQRTTPDIVSDWWWLKSRREYADGPAAYARAFLGLGTAWALPLWTLKIEIIASILMPIIALLVAKTPRLLLIFTVIYCAVIAVFASPLGSVIPYLPPFLVGACIVRYTSTCSRYVNSDSVWLAAGVAGLVLLAFGRCLVTADFRFNYNAPSATIVEALGGGIFILAVTARQNIFSALRHPSLVWLGDISYSLYLLHMPILALTAGIGGEILGIKPFVSGRFGGTISLTLVVLVVTLPLSALSYKFIELPGIELGKKFLARLTRKSPRERLQNV